MPETREQLIARLKATSPAYQEMTDEEFVSRFVQRHPQFESKFSTELQPEDIQMATSNLPEIGTDLLSNATRQEVAPTDLGSLGHAAYLKGVGGMEIAPEQEEGLRGLVQSSALSNIPFGRMAQVALTPDKTTAQLRNEFIMRAHKNGWASRTAPETPNARPANVVETTAEPVAPTQATRPTQAPPTPAEALATTPLTPAEQTIAQVVRDTNLPGRQAAIDVLAQRAPIEALRAATPVAQWPTVNAAIEELRAQVPATGPQADAIVETRVQQIIHTANNPEPVITEQPTQVAPQQQEQIVPEVEPEIVPGYQAPVTERGIADQQRMPTTSQYRLQVGQFQVPIESPQEAAAVLQQAMQIIGNTGLNTGQIGQLEPVIVDNTGAPVGYVTTNGEAFRGTPGDPNPVPWRDFTETTADNIQPNALPAPAPRQITGGQRQDVVTAQEPEFGRLDLGPAETFRHPAVRPDGFGNGGPTEHQQMLNDAGIQPLEPANTPDRVVQQYYGLQEGAVHGDTLEAIVAQEGENAPLIHDPAFPNRIIIAPNSRIRWGAIPAHVKRAITALIDAQPEGIPAQTPVTRATRARYTLIGPNNTVLGRFNTEEDAYADAVDHALNTAPDGMNEQEVQEYIDAHYTIEQVQRQRTPIQAAPTNRVIETPNAGQPEMVEQTPVVPEPAPTPAPRPTAPPVPATQNAIPVGERVELSALPENVKKMITAFKAPNSRMSPEAVQIQAKRAGFDIQITGREITGVTRNARVIQAATAPVTAAPNRKLTQEEFDAMPNVVDPWINNALKALSKPGVPDLIKADKVVSFLQSAGVSKNEIQWTGIERYLQGTQEISKVELAEYLKTNTYRFRVREMHGREDHTHYHYTQPGGKNVRAIIFMPPTKPNAGLTKEFLGAQTTVTIRGTQLLKYANIPDNTVFIKKVQNGFKIVEVDPVDGIIPVSPVYPKLERAEAELIGEFDSDNYKRVFQGELPGHYNENAFHTRVADRLINGMSMLHATELQADLFQNVATRRRKLIEKLVETGVQPNEQVAGERIPRDFFVATPTLVAKRAQLLKQITALRAIPNRNAQDQRTLTELLHDEYNLSQALPYAPFQFDFNLLTLKHLAIDAVRRGLKGIAFSHSKPQVIRWSQQLRQVVDKVSWKPGTLAQEEARLQQRPPRPIRRGQIPRFAVNEARLMRWIDGVANYRYTPELVNARFGLDLNRLEYRTLSRGIANNVATEQTQLRTLMQRVNAYIARGGAPEEPVQAPEPEVTTQNRIVTLSKNGQARHRIEVDPTGKILANPGTPREYANRKLRDLLEDDMAARILGSPNGEVSGEDITVGARVMKLRYDESALKNANAFFKQFGMEFKLQQIHHPYIEALNAIEKGIDISEIAKYIDFESGAGPFTVNLTGASIREGREIQEYVTQYRGASAVNKVNLKATIVHKLKERLDHMSPEEKAPMPDWQMVFTQQFINIVKKLGLSYFLMMAGAGLAGVAKDDKK